MLNSGKVAIVTGGGSGIGAALVRALAARGARVVIADVDEAAAKMVAADVNGAARAASSSAPSAAPVGAGSAGARPAGAGSVSVAALDVRDGAGVADLVAQVVDSHGVIDMMFNNAGIAVGGSVEELTLDHWDRVIDVNLRGVVHGVRAVYPVMLRQGHGHIINTASLAGLVPGPMLAPYAAVKHAVVGLSLSLRAEGAAKGVRVSAVCPGFVDTPLLRRVNPDLPQTEVGANASEVVRARFGRLYQPEALAQDVLRGICRNKALIVAPRSARMAWRMARYSPGVTMRIIVGRMGRG